MIDDNMLAKVEGRAAELAQAAAEAAEAKSAKGVASGSPNSTPGAGASPGLDKGFVLERLRRNRVGDADLFLGKKLHVRIGVNLLVEQKFPKDSGKPEPELLALRGAKLAYASEANARQTLDQAKIKDRLSLKDRGKVAPSDKKGHTKNDLGMPPGQFVFSDQRKESALWNNFYLVCPVLQSKMLPAGLKPSLK